MTIRNRVLVAKDVFTDNEICILPRNAYPIALQLAGIAWLRKEVPIRAHAEALMEAVTVVKQSYSNHHFWLLGAHTAPQPDNRISRHRRLWKSLATRGINVPAGVRSGEAVVVSESGIRWFGAIHIEKCNVFEIREVVEAEAASLFIAIPADVSTSLQNIVTTGWTHSPYGPAPKLLEWLVNNDGIAFWFTGAFDDPVSGVVAFASPETIRCLEININS